MRAQPQNKIVRGGGRRGSIAWDGRVANQKPPLDPRNSCILHS